MAVTFRSAEIEQLAVSPGATIYTVPANTTSQVIFANCTNESTGALTFTIHKIQSGGSAGDTNLYVDAKSIGAGKTDLVSEIIGMVLEAGDFITAFGSGATALNLTLSIKEIV